MLYFSLGANQQPQTLPKGRLFNLIWAKAQGVGVCHIQRLEINTCPLEIATAWLINSSMRCSTWRENDLTKLNRQVQLWVCPRFELPIPHLCISYTGRESVYPLSFIPSASCRSNFFTILSPSPLLGVETVSYTHLTLPTIYSV